MPRFGRVVLTFGLAAVLRSPTLVQAQSPSVDCAKASTAVERTICDSARLSALDSEMSALWSDVRQTLANDSIAGLREVCLQQQREWLTERNGFEELSRSSDPRLRNAMSYGLEQHYQQRINALRALQQSLGDNRSDSRASALRGRTRGGADEVPVSVDEPGVPPTPTTEPLRTGSQTSALQNPEAPPAGVAADIPVPPPGIPPQPAPSPLPQVLRENQADSQPTSENTSVSSGRIKLVVDAWRWRIWLIETLLLGVFLSNATKDAIRRRQAQSPEKLFRDSLDVSRTAQIHGLLLLAGVASSGYLALTDIFSNAFGSVVQSLAAVLPLPCAMYLNGKREMQQVSRIYDIGSVSRDDVIGLAFARSGGAFGIIVRRAGSIFLYAFAVLAVFGALTKPRQRWETYGEHQAKRVGKAVVGVGAFLGGRYVSEMSQELYEVLCGEIPAETTKQLTVKKLLLIIAIAYFAGWLFSKQ